MGNKKRVQRRCLSCARCRRRKIMCDARSPSCSACVEAEVPCLAWNAATNATAPRSITRYLEERIATLEGEVPLAGNLRLSSQTEPSGHYPWGHPTAVSLVAGCDSAIATILKDVRPCFLGLVDQSRMAGCIAVPTQIPSVQTCAVSDLNENHPRTIVNQQASVISPTSVPTRVADFLLFTYTSSIIHQCPILCEEEARSAFDALFPGPFNTQELATRDVYIVSLVMAISLSTAARNKLARAQSLATALFKNAILHISTVLTNDLLGLQALLLLIHYTWLNPTVGNLWLLTGISSEACIEQGLHQELPPTAIDGPTLDKRRRLFWCAWEMEIAVSAAFRRPIRISHKHVNIAFPSPHAHPPPPAVLSIPTFIWRFRRIETEIISILHHNDPLPDSLALETWRSNIERQASDWAQQVQHASSQNECPSAKAPWHEMALYSDIGHPYVLVLLYSPSNRIKNPSRPDLLQAFRASVRVAETYWEQVNSEFGRIKYTFQIAYHTFFAAVVFLRVLRTCQSEITQLFTLAEIEECANCFTRLLSCFGERWPAATRCREEYNHLLEPIMESYREWFRFWSTRDIAIQDTFLSPGEFANAFDEIDYENFIHVFNPLNGGGESLPEPPVMPSDWDLEFEFGMEGVLDLGQLDT